jgi:hypothetical protein
MSFASPRHGAPAARNARWTLSQAIPVVALACLALLFFARWFFRAHYLYEWDSAQYALGVLKFDVRLHQPHPPGYPLWIALLKGLHIFVGDLNTAQIVLGFVVTTASTALLYRLARNLYGTPAAVLAATFLLFSPTVIFYNAVASSYPADLLISTILGGLSARLWSEDNRIGPWAVFAIALLAGVRQSGAVMMAPLIGVSLCRAYRLDLRRWAVSALIGVGTFAAWYVPTALMNGGIAQYQSFASSTIVGYFRLTSILFGARAEDHIAMLRNDAEWACAAVVVAAVATAATWTVGTLAPREGLRPRARPEPGAAFYLLWIVPNVIYITLFHSVKPGYFVLDLPPLMLLAGRAAAPGLEYIGALWAGSSVAAASIVAAFAGATSTALAQGRYDGTLNRTTLASVRDSDEDMRAIERLVMLGPGPAGTLVVVVSSGPYGPTVRSLTVDLPDTRVVILFPGGEHGTLRQSWHYQSTEDKGESKVIAPEVRRILWVHLAQLVFPPSIATSFPSTRLMLAGKVTQVFESDVGDAWFDARFTLDRQYHLMRAGNMPPFVCQLGAGFIDPVSPGDLLWGAGPRSEIIVHEHDAAPVRLSLRVENPASPVQAVSIAANGAYLTLVRPLIGHDIVVDFQGVAGTNRVTFDYARWNHHPDAFAPLDPRPFAVAFRGIRCESGQETRLLFSL